MALRTARASKRPMEQANRQATSKAPKVSMPSLAGRTGAPTPSPAPVNGPPMMTAATPASGSGLPSPGTTTGPPPGAKGPLKGVFGLSGNAAPDAMRRFFTGLANNPGPQIGGENQGYHSPSTGETTLSPERLQGNSEFPYVNRALLPDIYRGNMLGWAGFDPFMQALMNPGQIDESQKRQTLQDTELAFNRATGQARESMANTGAGPGRSGVGNANLASLDMARGSAQAENLRGWDQYADQRRLQVLQSLFLPYLNTYNSAYGVANGSPASPGGGGNSWLGPALGAAGGIIGLAGGPAGAAAGASIGSSVGNAVGQRR